jgi:hypothetical protein
MRSEEFFLRGVLRSSACGRHSDCDEYDNCDIRDARRANFRFGAISPCMSAVLRFNNCSLNSVERAE